MLDSILQNTRVACNVTKDDESFDEQLIPLINSVLFEMNQMGIGIDGFQIEGEESTWNEFITEKTELLGAVAQLLGLRVRMVFDPPTSSMAADSFNKTIDRLEWRLNVAVDPADTEETS